jgi:hypothetical protein
VGATAAALVDLSTVAGNKISNPPWVKFQSAGWVNFPSAPTATIFMVETKARTDINTHEVQAKAAAAMRWCKHASDHAASVGAKPWKYLLVPHDEIVESKRLADYLRYEIKP